MRSVFQGWLWREEPGAVCRALSLGTSWYAARRGARRRDRLPEVPTFVVGGLSVGGAGKTPVVACLAARFFYEGRRVGIVARGYGARVGACVLVTHPDARQFGDEPSELRRSLPPSVTIHVGADRSLALSEAATSAKVLLVDDGFQDPTLPRSADIVVIDATSPRSVMPAGPLREPIGALERADLIWLHRVDEPGACALPDPWVPHISSVVRPLGVRIGAERHGVEWLRGRPVLALAGVARPSSFCHTLREAGARVCDVAIFGDHHWFSAADLQAVEKRAGRGVPIVTTAKDAERLPPGFECAVLETTTEIVGGGSILDSFLGAGLAKGPAW